MKFIIHAIGKDKSSELKALQNEYTKRLAWQIEIRELQDNKSGSEAEIMQREAALLLNGIKVGDFVIALDERGSLLTSIEFADKISKISLQGHSEVHLIIGGAFGLANPVKERANLSLSLGKMTFPHMIVRLLIIEQIYRAYTIVNKHPYHKV